MKPNQAINQLFDHARELPAEIQLEQVETMISSLPLAAAGLSWIYKIYLKSLIMPSVSVILVAGSVLVMTGLSKEDIQSQAAIPGTSSVISYIEGTPEEIPADVILLDTFEQPQPGPSTEPKPEPTFEPNPDLQSTPAFESKEPKEKAKVKPEKEAKEKKKEKPLKEPNFKAKEKPLKEPNFKAKEKSKAKIKEANPRPDHLRGLIPTLAADKQFNISEKEMMRLKRTLYKELVSDGLISSKKSAVLLQFMESEIIVNEQTLDSGLYSKYKKLLLEGGAEPSPDFQVRMSPDYILVGTFSEEGFEGIGRGKGMELKFITGDNEDFWSANSPESDLWIKLSDDEGGLFKEGN